MSKKKIIIISSIANVVIIAVAVCLVMYNTPEVPELIGTWKIDEELTRKYEENSSCTSEEFKRRLKNPNTLFTYKENKKMTVSDNPSFVFRYRILDRKGSTFILLYKDDNEAVRGIIAECKFIILSPDKLAVSEIGDSFYFIYTRVE